MTHITITPTAYADLILAIDICPVEISGLGKVEVYGEEKRIVETFLFPQKCTLYGTELDNFDLGSIERYWSNLMRQGRGEEINNLRLWWHSHVYGRTIFSIIDRDNIERLGCGAANEITANPWWISIVGNKRRGFGVRLDFFWPRREIWQNLSLRLAAGSLAEVRLLYLERRERMEGLIREMVELITPEPEQSEEDKDDR